VPLSDQLWHDRLCRCKSVVALQDGFGIADQICLDRDFGAPETDAQHWRVG